MKTNQLFLTLVGLLLTLFVTLPNAAYAQVKIGTNHQTIGSSSNFEVEAANGKKVIVNKADGSMVIETTPTSATASDLLLGVDATGKVVTVDRATVVNSVTATGSVGVAPYLRLDGSKTGSTASPTTLIPATGLTTTSSNLITYNPANGVVTIPSTGLYFYAASATGEGDLGPGATSNDLCMILNGFDSSCARSTRFGPTAVVTGLLRFAAGTTIPLAVTTASNVVTTGTFPIKVSFFKISD